METNFQKSFAERCFSLIDEYALGFSSSVVGYDMLTPPDLEREFGLTGKLFPTHNLFVLHVVHASSFWCFDLPVENIAKQTWFTFDRRQHFPWCNGLGFSFPHETGQGVVCLQLWRAYQFSLNPSSPLPIFEGWISEVMDLGSMISLFALWTIQVRLQNSCEGTVPLRERRPPRWWGDGCART